MDFPGLKTDCETLLHRFQESGSVRFEEFSAIWKEMKFSTIFYGKTGQLEKNNFAKEALSVACLHFLPPFTFQIRVGALYLLYGLYNAQLGQPKQKIRIALKDWQEVLEFQKELIKAQHFDAAYILRALRLQKSFHYTAMPVLLTYKLRSKLCKQPPKEEFKDCSNKVTELITSSVLEEMLNVHSHYQKMKCAISADKSQPDKALSLIKEDFAINLNKHVLEHQQWLKDKFKKATRKNGEEEERNGGTSQESGSERASALAKLKAKSYSTVHEVSRSRRHRQARLESSESGSDLGETKGQKSKKHKKQVQPRVRRKSAELRADGNNYDKSGLKGTLSGRLKMPVIREEEEESSSEEDCPPPKRKRRR
ncbi:snRNA-activating protein complex subunit 1 [Microcaecilia unicolor]|uniref:snRNA-activating protein complex subunit 1 n=1 Tax=Microcaecilia unicolor TaxID=1415580 RepID=A0A6P7Z0H8_9AMPH|nr:snRNA-activating protein complex subunit 1 [Microcaecilia unicolor]XP_030070720.1 snRNA-activating protein complex subunit 1 [Microcaecilia unicolor]XP_030070721.1 snRNA-activating protein complex subunit 1 [Microcaecilia unicolor]XP_030070722.1 snRNA-activating protein complex subunit 1 [Microcaecilia unicolor]XP_030070723.1 snRNA-activating protein complex subunit 1 [Microcaecilia unicolor]